jgi:hypothetical protein
VRYLYVLSIVSILKSLLKIAIAQRTHLSTVVFLIAEPSAIQWTL